jgi:hypothetical protein
MRVLVLKPKLRHHLSISGVMTADINSYDTIYFLKGKTLLGFLAQNYILVLSTQYLAITNVKLVMGRFVDLYTPCV